MESFVKWMELVEKYSSDIEEDDAKVILNFKIFHNYVNDEDIVLNNLFQAYQFINYKLTEKTLNVDLYLNRSENDFELPKELVNRVCEHHQNIFNQLVFEQGESYHIDSFKRYKLLRELSTCTYCHVDFTLTITIIKIELLKYYYRFINGKDLMTDARLIFWFSKQRFIECYNIINMFKQIPKPMIVIFKEEILFDNGFINCLNLNDEKFWPHFEKALQKVPGKYIELTRLIEKQNPVAISESLGYIPPEYWLSGYSKEVGVFSSSLLELFKADKVFLISILHVISENLTSDENKGNSFRFSLNREFQVDLEVVFSKCDVILNGMPLIISKDQQSKLIELYEEMLYSKYYDSNMKLVRNAIVLAGNADYLSILQNTDKLIRYYRFEYNNLLKEKFKEQSEVVKSLVLASQTMKSKLVESIDEIIKNIITVFTVLLGLITSIVFMAGRSQSHTKDFVIVAMYLFVYTYIPIYTCRIVKMVELAIKRIDDFYDDMRVITKIYDYPLVEIISSHEENTYPGKQLIGVARKSIIFFSFLYLVCGIVSLFLSNIYFYDLWIKDLILKFHFIVISSLLLFIIPLFLSFYVMEIFDKRKYK